MSGLNFLLLMIAVIVIPIIVGVVARIWAQRHRQHQRRQRDAIANRYMENSPSSHSSIPSARPKSTVPDSLLKEPSETSFSTANSSTSTSRDAQSPTSNLLPSDTTADTPSHQPQPQTAPQAETAGSGSAVKVRVIHFENPIHEQKIQKAAIAHGGDVSAPYHYVHRDEVSITFAFPDPTSATNFKSNVLEICPSARF